MVPLQFYGVCMFPQLTQKEKEEMNARTRAELGPDWETTRDEMRERCVYQPDTPDRLNVGDMVKFIDFPGDETFIIIESRSADGWTEIDLLTVNGEVMRAHNSSAFEVIK